LCRKIRETIQAEGPISFSRYMDLALYEPGLGYYRNGLVRFGVEGDFVTAVELGDLFARCLARHLDETAGRLDEPWTLMEIGAGSGVLARDLLTHLQNPPARYLILETSGELRDRQQQLLKEFPDDLSGRIEWLDCPPTEPFVGVIVANEVIDALPVDRFVIRQGRTRELCVDWRNGALAWTETEPGPRLDAAIKRIEQDLPDGLADGFASEVCVDLPEWLASVTGSLDRGQVLLADYGYPRREYYMPGRAGGTLVCQYRHRAHFEPFFLPGLCDISSFVDFTAVAEAADGAGLSVEGFVSQSWFLLSSGILRDLEEVDEPVERSRLASQVRHLTLPGEMGEKFKVLALGREFDQAGSAFAESDQLHRL